MKCFKLDSNGDVAIVKKKIVMVEGSELTAQTVKTVLGTNKGEWFGNLEEGITFANIFGKNKKVTTTSKKQNSDELTYTEELQLAERLRNRLGGGN